MENDELKNHIEGRRQEFEVYEFDHSASWDHISERLDDQSKGHVKIPHRYLWRVAAVFIISLSTTFYFAWNSYSNGNIDSISSAELAEADAYYGTLISNKVLQLKNKQIDVEEHIFQDIDALDIAFNELRDDLKDNADNDEVIGAMILNYKIKLEILERILSELDVEEAKINKKLNENEG